MEFRITRVIDTTTNFILHNVSHKPFEAGVGFARHGYSLPVQAGQARRQPPRLIINRDRQYKTTATVNGY